MANGGCQRMNRPDLLASLLAATGDLQPTAETTAAELNDLRRALLDSLAQTAGHVDAESAPPSADARLTSELQYLIAQHLSAPPADTPARLFSASAPAGGYAGVRIKGGTLTIGSNDHVSNDVLVVQPAETITLRVTLDPGAAAAGPASGPGAEAMKTNVTLPDSVTFVFTPATLAAVETGPASLSPYGSSFTLTRNQA